MRLSSLTREIFRQLRRLALLKKGLNFAVTPANIPATEIIAKVESAVRQLDAEQADTVRTALFFKRQNHQSLTSRRRCETRSVVMDTDTYHTKMPTPAENGPYKLLNKHSKDRLTSVQVVRKAANLEAKQTFSRGRLQQDQTSTQTAA